jgi:hypothetical protein
MDAMDHAADRSHRVGLISGALLQVRATSAPALLARS